MSLYGRVIAREFADADRNRCSVFPRITAANSRGRVGRWPLFKDLHAGDEPVAHALHFPTTRVYAASIRNLSAAKLVSTAHEEDLAELDIQIKNDEGNRELSASLRSRA